MDFKSPKHNLSILGTVVFLKLVFLHTYVKDYNNKHVSETIQTQSSCFYYSLGVRMPNETILIRCYKNVMKFVYQASINGYFQFGIKILIVCWLISWSNV